MPLRVMISGAVIGKTIFFASLNGADLGLLGVTRSINALAAVFVFDMITSHRGFGGGGAHRHHSLNRGRDQYQ